MLLATAAGAGITLWLPLVHLGQLHQQKRLRHLIISRLPLRDVAELPLTDTLLRLPAVCLPACAG